MVFLQWKYSGLFLSLSASTVTTLSSMIVSYLQEFHPFAKSVWRFVAAVVPATNIMLIYCYRKQHLKILKGFWPLDRASAINFMWFMVRNIFASGSTLLKFYALRYMSLVDYTTVASCSPVLISILACFFLGEPFGVFGFLSTSISLAGVLCVIRPTFLTGNELDYDLTVGALYAFICILCRSISIVMLRHLKEVRFSVVLFGFGLFGTVESLALALGSGVMDLPSTPISSALTVCMGLLSSAGHVFMTLALKVENAGPVMVVKTCDVIFTFMWQVIFLYKIPDLYSILGGCIVLLGVLLVAFRKYIESLDAEHLHRRWLGFILK